MNKLKYYWCDWDDNAVYMPTKIHLLKEWKKVSISTANYANIRTSLWDNWYSLLEKWKSFIDFSREWDKQFKIDSLKAEEWPTWPSIVQCINNANILWIITARWHSRGIMYEVIKKMIIENHNWICKNSMLESMNLFLYHAKKNWINIDLKEDWDALLKYYLNLLRFYPISNRNVCLELWINWNVSSPEKGKIKALLNFINHTKITSQNIIHKDFSPQITVWFSDDDKWTIELIRKFLQEYWTENWISPYLWDTSSWKAVRQHV